MFAIKLLLLDMQIILIAIGKTDSIELARLIETYQNRLQHYIKFQLSVVQDVKNAKNLSKALQKEKEGKAILGHVQASDDLILFDERGKRFSSVGFSSFLQKKMNSGTKKLCFVIGGTYGFSDGVYGRGNQRISLSPMTFSHQMARLFAVEQLYRAFTILRNEPYHHR